MAAERCHIAVNLATEGAFTPEEIDALLDRMEARAKAAGEAEPTQTARENLATAARELTKDELFAMIARKKQEVMAKLARRRQDAKFDAMPARLNGGKKLVAANVGDELQGEGVSSSVDAMGEALSDQRRKTLERGLEEREGLVDRMVNTFGIMGPVEFEENIATELWRATGGDGQEPTGDEDALHAAKVIAAVNEDSRVRLNSQGASIARLKGYMGRQVHNRLEIAGGMWRGVAERGRALAKEGLGADAGEASREGSHGAFQAWRDVITPLLHDDTYKGLTLEDVDFTKWDDEADEKAGMKAMIGRRRDLRSAQALHAQGILSDPTSIKELFLYHAWWRLATGQHELLTGAADDGAEWRAPASKATQVSKSRTFIFQGPKEWVTYNRGKYGGGGLYRTTMLQLDRAARNEALMRFWGPNPEAAYDRQVTRQLGLALEKGDLKAAEDIQKARQSFDQINGSLAIPESLRAAALMRGVRNWEQMTKLSGMVLSKATDLPMAGQTMARVGGGFLQGYEGAFRGVLNMLDKDMREAAELLDVGARSFAGHLSSPLRLRNGDGSSGAFTWGVALNYKAQFFEALNDAMQRGWAAMYSRHLGVEAAKPWEGLREGTRETFERFGVTPEMWELVRPMAAPLSEGGETYFTLDKLGALSPDALHEFAGTPAKARTEAGAGEIRNRIDLSFRAMTRDMISNVTNEARGRERLMMTGGTRPGTFWGEVARSFTQFRGFTTSILGRHVVPAARGYAGYRPAHLLGHLFLATVLAGWMSMNAKRIAGGRAPLGLYGADAKQTMAIWTASLVQGGGLGIYGDFLFGESNRMGVKFGVGALAGPAVGDFEQVAEMVIKAVHGGDVSESTGKSQLPGEAVRFAGHSIPLVNLWYTRVAFDYLVLWRMQELASPGYLNRIEERERKEGGDWLLPPTSAAP